MASQWQPEDIENVLIDPRVTGAGGYPQIIDDEQWLRVNRKLVRQMGANKYLASMLRAMRDHGQVPPWLKTAD